MNVTVYVPKELEEKLQKRADGVGMTPASYIQSLLREAMSEEPSRFSDAFAALAGSWEDDRSARDILRDIKLRRSSSSRPALR